MLKNKGINMSQVRLSNRKAILSYLNEYGASSRKKIAGDLKLASSTLTVITNELKNENLIIELGEINENKVGRKQVLIDINWKNWFCLNLELQKNRIIFTETDFKANIILTKEWNFMEKNIDNELKKVIQFIKRRKKERQERLLGIGVLVYGEVKENIALHTSIPNIYNILQKEINLPIFIENNTVALVKSELFLKKDYKDFWILRYGMGIGSSVVIDKEILEGTKNKIVEIGHIELEEHSGIYCNTCKKIGCLESEIHFHNIVEELEKENKRMKGNETEFQFINKYSLGKKKLYNNLDLLAKYFKIAISLIETEEIILCGEIFGINEYLEHFIKKLNLNEKYKNKIKYMSDYDYKKKIAGSILVINNFFREFK